MQSEGRMRDLEVRKVKVARQFQRKGSPMANSLTVSSQGPSEIFGHKSPTMQTHAASTIFSVITLPKNFYKIIRSNSNPGILHFQTDGIRRTGNKFRSHNETWKGSKGSQFQIAHWQTMKIFLGCLNGSLKNLISIRPATHVNVGESKIEIRNAQEEKTWEEPARTEKERVRGQESESCPAIPEKR